MIEHAAVPDLKTALDEGRATLIDVREFFEFQAGHVPGAMHMPMHTIPVRMDEIPSSGEVYVICESGSRSWQVAAFLQQRGVRAINVHGGMGSWRMAGFPTEQAVTA
jgi:rhodanese-related sulfurtransferase